jgi:hypothetical protein
LTGKFKDRGCASTRSSMLGVTIGWLISGNILGRGYLGGLGLTIGGVFGLIAGERAVTL